ncbi:MAG TPA: VTT domain-containing protein [Bacillales bacterium]|nr:VTT domain-containing protein [Bacillales bacterium]
MNQLLHWIDQYGYTVLFLALFLELIALPIPTEILMSYVGFLVYRQEASLLLSLLAASSGTFAGLSASYWIGLKLGYPFFYRYGRLIHVGHGRLEKMSSLFRRHGLKLLLVTNFIPGIRHMSGYFSGISRVPYRKFAFTTAFGSLIWTATFLSLGTMLGPRYAKIESYAAKYTIWMIAASAVIATGLFLLNKYRIPLRNAAVQGSLAIIRAYGGSERNLKLLITVAAAAFIGFSSLFIGIIQDFIAQDFGEFNFIVNLILFSFFQQDWSGIMIVFYNLSSWTSLSCLVLLCLSWVVVKGRQRALELRFLFLLVTGGVAYAYFVRYLLQLLFHWFRWTFWHIALLPDIRLILSAVVYGFLAYIFMRHLRTYYLQFAVIAFSIAALTVIGLARIYFQTQLPSGVASGYVFGGMWVSFVVLLLEVFRLLHVKGSSRA